MMVSLHTCIHIFIQIDCASWLFKLACLEAKWPQTVIGNAGVKVEKEVALPCGLTPLSAIQGYNLEKEVVVPS